MPAHVRAAPLSATNDLASAIRGRSSVAVTRQGSVNVLAEILNLQGQIGAIPSPNRRCKDRVPSNVEAQLGAVRPSYS